MKGTLDTINRYYNVVNSIFSIPVNQDIDNNMLYSDDISDNTPRIYEGTLLIPVI